MKEGYIDFDEYIRQGEPDKKEKAAIWQTAIGLQAVDGLKTSDYIYLRHIGFKVSNDMFALHSWYFRNALVRANYKNAVKGIDYSPIYLERFFRNLLLGEKWDLRNRYLHIHPTEDWKVQPNLAIPEQLPHKYSANTPQVPHKLHTDNLNIQRLVQIVGDTELSVKEIMECIGLKDRKNVLNLYLNPAIAEGYVCLLYPDKPRHPRQKYQLTMKGVTLYNELKK
jgi:hypothetical protein